LIGCGVVAVIAIVGSSCSTASEDAGPAAQTASPTPSASGLVDVGDHSLYLTCEGQGDPTVVFESGLGDSSIEWAMVTSVLDSVSFDTRACAYDRAGVGESDPWPNDEQPASARDVANDLHALLSAGGIGPPYVLVGHSIGGIFVRMFASMFPDEVAGMVLLDPSSEFQFQGRFGRWDRKTNPYDPHALMDGITPIDVPATLSDMATATSIGAPLIVLTAGVGPGPGWVQRGWLDFHERIAGMSPDSVHAVVGHAEHYVHYAEPEVVIEAVRQVALAARNGTQLPMCSQMFAPSTVTCM
jgi:pimeloyl-ACP methyl ester carboxylesterase